MEEFQRSFYPFLYKKNSEQIGKRLANAPRDIEFEEFFLKGSPKQIGKCLAGTLIEMHEFIDEVYLSKQSVQRQDDICRYVFYYMVHDFQNDRDCFGGI